MPNTYTAFGAARTVTGSRHLLETNGKRILVDCGLFQGLKEIRERNWQPFPVPPSSIDAIVLTHAHTDHIGYLPRIIANGYAGPVYATSATIDLVKLSLPDSGRLQEEFARHANKHGVSRHHPALPLYTEADAFEALKRLEPIEYDTMSKLPGGVTFRYLRAGHILGAAFAELYFSNGERILMSGDLGRYHVPILKDPTPVDFAEYLVVESTYGNRLHASEDVEAILESVIRGAAERGGIVLVPSFSIGRTQDLLYRINQLQEEGRIPRIPFYVDSPMATSATAIYAKHTDEHDLDMRGYLERGDDPLQPDLLSFVRDREQSKELNSRRGPMVILAGSGMCTGGRIVHHLLRRLNEPDTTVLFTGYQAAGTLGRDILEGADRVRVLGHDVEVRARIEKLNSLSAHADQAEILRWLHGFKTPPKRTFIVHGEPPAQDALKEKIVAELGWNVAIPEQGERFELV
ncbi:MAG: MBL fold metallo-hydrolase [Chthonomonadaceae bacterium]|nr:MBL fold metallo-hydrolase [Chthonomonadaceae bacterium]